MRIYGRERLLGHGSGAGEAVAGAGGRRQRLSGGGQREARRQRAPQAEAGRKRAPQAEAEAGAAEARRKRAPQAEAEAGAGRSAAIGSGARNRAIHAWMDACKRVISVGDVGVRGWARWRDDPAEKNKSVHVYVYITSGRQAGGLFFDFCPSCPPL